MKLLKYFLTVVSALILNLTTMNAQSAYDFQNSQPQQEQLVVIHTPYGDMTAKLYNETPLHRDNFIKLIKAQIYDGTLFHRVIKNFMIQGGDPTSKYAKPGQMLGMGDLGSTIPAEIKPGLIHKKGALAAARQGDQVNPERASSDCQFYIVQGRAYTPEEINIMKTRYRVAFTPQQEEAYSTVGGTPHLDGQYTVFGEIIEGLEIIDQIAATQTDGNDRPLQDIPMTVTLK